MGNWKSQTTAEHVVGVLDAVSAFPRAMTINEAAEFLEISPAQAEAALGLASDLHLVGIGTGTNTFIPEGPLCRLSSGSSVAAKAAILRLALEPFDAFVTFRERWLATADPIKAAAQAKIVHTLDPHREEIKETFLSLATFAGIIETKSGGQYQVADSAGDNPLLALAASASELAIAEQKVRSLIGPSASEQLSRVEVIDPLAQALRRSGMSDGAGDAVTTAGNAVESFLFQEGQARSLAVANATGVNAKLNLFATHNPPLLPSKLVKIGNYLGHLRNAADHGIDAEIGVAWNFRQTTGVEYVFVACSFINSAYEHLSGGRGTI